MMQIQILDKYERTIVAFALRFLQSHLNKCDVVDSLEDCLAGLRPAVEGESCEDLIHRLAAFADQVPSGHTIEIEVEDGHVTGVVGLPENWVFQVNDYDELVEQDEQPSYYSPEAHGTDEVTEHVNQGGFVSPAPKPLSPRQQIQSVYDDLAWMTDEQIESCYGTGELDSLALCENRDRHDRHENLWQLATDIVNDDKEIPVKEDFGKPTASPDRLNPPPAGHGVGIKWHSIGGWQVVNEDGEVIDPVERSRAEAIARAWEFVDQSAK